MSLGRRGSEIVKMQNWAAVGKVLCNDNAAHDRNFDYRFTAAE